MDKRGKVKLLLFSAVVVLFIVSLVYASKNVFSSPESSEIKLVKEYDVNSENFYPIKVYDYTDKSTNSKFKTQIITFNDSEKLDSWIKNKVEKSSETKEIDGNIVYMDKNKNYIFWRSENSFVQIISKDIISSDAGRTVNSLKFMGVGTFPEQLIRKYLLKYPSQCLADNCFSQKRLSEEKVRNGLWWFLNENLSDSIQYPEDSTCPVNESGWNSLEGSSFLTNDEIKTIKSICDKMENQEEILVSNEMKECGKMIDSYLNNNYVSDYNKKITFNECLLREKFKEEYENYTSEELNELFDKRNEILFKTVNSDNELDKIQNISEKIIFGPSLRIENSDPSKLAKIEDEIIEQVELNNKLNTIKSWFEQ